MVSRSLTDIFILMRNNSTKSRQSFPDQGPELSSDRVALIGKKSRFIVNDDVEMGDLEEEQAPPPPPWMDELLDIRHNMTLISQQKKEVEELQNKHIQRPTFSGDTATERQIEELTLNISRLFASCHRLVQQIQSKGSRSSWNEKRLRDAVVQSLVASLQDLSQNFRSSQGQYLRKITGRDDLTNKYLDVIDDPGDSSTFNYDETFLEAKNSRNPQWTQQHLLALEEDNVGLQVREHEVQQIVKSIIDLNTVFRDLASMVHEQSGVVDRIDYNVENTHVKVEEGVKHLQKAANYQKRNRKCVFIVSTVFITILIIIFLVAFGT